MTRHLALLVLSAAVVSCMETKETVQRMVMVRTSGSENKPETKGFIYKRDSDGPPQVIKMDQEEVMKELSKMYKFPEAFDAPIPYANGPFYDKEEESHKPASVPRTLNVPAFGSVEEGSEKKRDNVPAAAHSPVDSSKLYAPHIFDDYANDFNDYLVSLGYHDDFFRGGSWSDYGNTDVHDTGVSNEAPKLDRYTIDNDNLESQSTEKYAIYTLSSTGNKNKRSKNKDSHPASGKDYTVSDKDYRRNGNIGKDTTDKDNKNKYDFRKDEYASEFDGYYDTDDQDYEKPSEKKGDKYHRDFVHEYTKDNPDSGFKESRNIFKRVPAEYDNVQHVLADDKADEEEKHDALDLNGRVDQELRDCCYEEKPKQDGSSGESNVKIPRKTFIYKVRERH